MVNEIEVVVREADVRDFMNWDGSLEGDVLAAEVARYCAAYARVIQRAYPDAMVAVTAGETSGHDEVSVNGIHVPRADFGTDAEFGMDAKYIALLGQEIIDEL